MKAVGPVACFRIQRTDFLTMLSDNVLLAQGLFRMLIAPGQESPALMPPPGPSALIERPALPQALDIALLLRQHPLLERASAPQLMALTGSAAEIPLRAGTNLFAADDMPAVYLLIEGEVILESPTSAPLVVPEGSTLGLAETLAGVATGWTARVNRDGRALRLDREPLFNVLGDEVDLMQSLFGGVLRLRAGQKAELP